MDWRDKAACLTVDPELFFPVGNTGPAVDQIEVQSGGIGERRRHGGHGGDRLCYPAIVILRSASRPGGRSTRRRGGLGPLGRAARGGGTRRGPVGIPCSKARIIIA